MISTHDLSRLSKACLAAGTLLLGATACGGPGFPEPPDQNVRFGSCGVSERGPFGVAPLRSEYITMRDNVRIAVDVILPDSIPVAGAPTILLMTRYWRATEGQGVSPMQRFWVSHGYAVVSGDVRGTGASFGLWPHQRSRDETLDFGEIMTWITKQPWSDGAIGGWGSSYTANTADWMVERNHPALKAVVSRFPDYDPYADLYFPGGVPNAYMGSKWGANVKKMDLNTPRIGADSVARGIRPVDGPDGRRALDSAVAGRRHMPGMYEAMRSIVYKDDAPEAWSGASMDDWGIHSHAAAVQRAGTPIQSWASWFDAGTANGVLHRYMTLDNPQNVVVGAWSHGGPHDADPFNSASTDRIRPSSCSRSKISASSTGSSAVGTTASRPAPFATSRWGKRAGRRRRSGRPAKPGRNAGICAPPATSAPKHLRRMVRPLTTMSTSL